MNNLESGLNYEKKDDLLSKNLFKLRDLYQTILDKRESRDSYNMINEMHEVDHIAKEVHKLIVEFLAEKEMREKIPKDISDEVLRYTREFKNDMETAHMEKKEK